MKWELKCVDTGYFLMLSPLKAGPHTIRFAAANADESFGLDVTYHLTVLEDEDADNAN